jgi:hypothetical protein
VTASNPVPGLTRDLHQRHEAPDQVQGGVHTMVNPTLTPAANPLKSLTRNSAHARALP